MIRREARDGGEARGNEKRLEEMRRGRRERVDNGSRESIEIERKEKETKGN